MSNAQSDAYILRFLEETTFGITPNAAMDNTRNTGESFNFNISTSVSKEINGDGQVSGVNQTGASADGSFNFEFSFSTYIKQLQAALRSTFTTPLTISAATISASSTDNSFNDTGTAFSTAVAGQWVKVAGFTGAAVANNQLCLITSKTNSKIIVAQTLVTAAASPTITMKGSMLRNGALEKSFSIEKEFSDIAQFISYTGMRVNAFNLDLASGGDVTGSFGFMGLNSKRATTTIGTGSPNAATTTTTVNTVNNVISLREGGAAITGTFASKVGFALANNLRAQPAIGSLANVGIGFGKSNITGSLSVYFADGSLYDKYINNTDSSLSFALQDDAGNINVFTLHKLKFTNGKVVAGSENADILADMTFQAIKHPVYNTTIQIDSFPV